MDARTQAPCMVSAKHLINEWLWRYVKRRKPTRWTVLSSATPAHLYTMALFLRTKNTFFTGFEEVVVYGADGRRRGFYSFDREEDGRETHKCCELLDDLARAALAPTLALNKFHLHGDYGGFTLRFLHMHRCQLGDAGVRSLAAALRADTAWALERLILSDNNITDVGATTIAHELSFSSTCSTCR